MPAVHVTHKILSTVDLVTQCYSMTWNHDGYKLGSY
jgi:hypothetical protein